MYTIKPLSDIQKNISIPPDKSISHRAVMLAAISRGKTVIEPLLLSDDTLATLDCIKKLGVKTKLKGNKLNITGSGLYFHVKNNKKNKPIFLSAGESGTTMRILSGILAGQKFITHFGANKSLCGRPMGRIIEPLNLMGADIRGTPGKPGKEKPYPPLLIFPIKKITGISYKSPIASAQVKSAILLAGLYAKNKTSIEEPFVSRDHTEQMLKIFGANILTRGKRVTITPGRNIYPPKKIFIPGDFSSAAFFIVLGLILKKSQITIKNVNINPTRCGMLAVLKRMGAKIEIKNRVNQPEPYADITVKSSNLSGTTVKEEEIPSMIDEIPILCVAAAFARGKTVIKGVNELKVKETDRINSMEVNLRRIGVNISHKPYSYRQKDNLLIEIKPVTSQAKQAVFKSFDDHRTAMSMIVTAMALKNKSSIDNVKCINKSFPEFISTIESLRK